MSDEPVVLNDDDFDEDVPPGYRSHKAKERYIPLMTILLGGTFVLQFIVPFVIMMVGLPMMAMQQVHQTTGQYVKMTDWQGALWYPASEVQPGGPWGVVTPDRGLQSKLMAMDYRGKPIEHTPFELETTPEWFVADGDRLWGVSKNEVVELNRDGSRPIVMRPTRYLIYASQPLLFEGKLAIVDYDEENQWSLYRFERGEWVRAVGLAIPDFSPKRQTSAAVDAPADALNASGAAAGEQSSDGRSPSPQNTKTPGSISSNHPSVDVNEVRIVMIGETPHVMFEQNHRLYHHSGLPVQKASDGTGWTSIALSSHQDSMQETAWALTSVAGGPAAVVHFPDYSKPRMQLWRFQEGQWALTTESKSLSGGGIGSSLRAVTTEDGSRCFVILEIMNGFSHELLELHAGGITKVSKLSDGAYNNPFSGSQLVLQFASQGSSLVLILIMLFGATWLMHRYRDPNYYKGRVAVEYASLLRRAVALLIDVLIFNVPVWAVWYWWYGQQDEGFLQLAETFFNDPREFVQGVKFELIFSLAWVAGWTLIYWLLLAWGGCSPGKLVCGVRVTRANLNPPGLLRATIRILVGIAETTFGFVIPVALIAFLQDRQRLGDLVAGTVVVRSGSLRAGRQQQLANSQSLAGGR